MRAVAFALLFPAVAVAAPVPKAVKPKLTDAEAFVGTWDTVVSEQDGKPMTKAVWTFEPDLTMWSKSGGEQGKGTKWPIKIDPDKSPKEIEIGHYPGIYEFDGNDIRIIFGYAKGRPTGFEPQPNTHYVLLRRVAQK